MYDVKNVESLTRYLVSKYLKVRNEINLKDEDVKVPNPDVLGQLKSILNVKKEGKSSESLQLCAVMQPSFVTFFEHKTKTI